MTSDRTTVLTTLVTAGWGNFSAGDVAAPCGHVTAIDLSSERNQMGEVLLDAEVDPALLGIFNRSWYTVEEFDGIAEVVITEHQTMAAARARVLSVDGEHRRWQGVGS